jgi:TPR repeat protein
MLKRILAGLIVAVVMAGVAVAGPLEDGLAAYDRDDWATALKLLRPLAEQGNAQAQRSLGDLYANGQGVPKDYVEALKWHELGYEQEFAEALKGYQSYAEQGDPAAQFSLGVIYTGGAARGVSKDLVLAHMWFDLAAERGDNAAAEARDDVAKQMTPDQIAKAQRMSREWKPTTQP